MLHLLRASLLDIVDDLGTRLRGLGFLQRIELGLVQHHLTSLQSIVARLRDFASFVQLGYGSIHIPNHWYLFGELFDWVNDRIKAIGEVTPEAHIVVCVCVCCLGVVLCVFFIVPTK